MYAYELIIIMIFIIIISYVMVGVCVWGAKRVKREKGVSVEETGSGSGRSHTATQRVQEHANMFLYQHSCHISPSHIQHWADFMELVFLNQEGWLTQQIRLFSVFLFFA